MAFRQEDFYLSNEKLVKTAKESIKGSYKVSIYMQLLIIVSLLACFLIAYFLVDTFFRKTWIVILSIVVMSFVYVFVSGTLNVGRCKYFFNMLTQEENLYEPFKAFNNFWKYGRLNLVKIIKMLLWAILFTSIFLIIVLIMYVILQEKFVELFGMAVFPEGATFAEIFPLIIVGIFTSQKAGLVIYIACVLIVGVPLIFKAFRYNFIEWYMANDTKTTIRDCFEKSVKLYKNNKSRYLKFLSRYILHYILCVITLGIYLLWFLPYFRTSKAIFFKDIISDF